jgi:hypothetical protein
LDTESKRTVTYSSRTIITTEEYDIKMPCGIRTLKMPCGMRTLNHSIGEREERKRTMRTKKQVWKKWPGTGKMVDKRNHNINQRNRKQKQSTKDALERKEQVACNRRIWDQLIGTPQLRLAAQIKERENSPGQ